jgi:hypothetical protein
MVDARSTLLCTSSVRVNAGAWRGGYREGQGVLEWQSGERYTGAFKSGLQHGYGVCEYSDGERYDGMWLRGQPSDGMTA